MPSYPPIRAAGVVLLRSGDEGLEYLVVHRPGRKDWSLPKGKLEAGEHVLTAAVRECDEETGFSPVLQAPLPLQSYSVGGRPKVVHYWRARVREEVGFAPDDEVDEIQWLPVSTVHDRLTYPSEARLVELATALPSSLPMVILRHTQAMKRSQFDGDVDAERPLSGKGRSQSKSLVPLIDAFGVTAVHASSARRCTETVKALAKQLDVRVTKEPLLTEEGHRDDPAAAADRAREIALTAEPLVLCSHRPVLPTILASMADALGIEADDPRWAQAWDAKLPPGGFIVVHRDFAPDGSVSVVGIEQHTLSAGGGH
jgi:8-oxo-(d)GTP phosphatase